MCIPGDDPQHCDIDIDRVYRGINQVFEAIDQHPEFVLILIFIVVVNFVITDWSQTE